MTDIIKSKLPVHPGAGRQIVHDPRSRNFPAKTAKPKSVLHQTSAVPVDQGSLGCCTGSAAVNLLNTRMFAGERRKAAGRNNMYLTQDDALQFYSRATQLDPFRGSWPPTDTGSSGLAVAKALKEKGFIQEYRHAFGFDHLLETLPLQPVLIGTAWYSGMTFPAWKGSGFFASPTGEYLGGHEYVCLGVNLRDKYLTFLNSWGPQWPEPGFGGRFRMKIDDFKSLLEDQGDVIVPVNWV